MWISLFSNFVSRPTYKTFHEAFMLCCSGACEDEIFWGHVGEGYFGFTNNQVYIDRMFVYVCLQLSGCVNLIFCTFICWDSLVSSAAIAEDGSNILHGVPCRQGHCYFGACAVVTVQGFAQPSFGGTYTVPSVKQCLSSQHRGTQSSQLQLSAML